MGIIVASAFTLLAVRRVTLRRFCEETVGSRHHWVSSPRGNEELEIRGARVLAKTSTRPSPRNGRSPEIVRCITRRPLFPTSRNRHTITSIIPKSEEALRNGSFSVVTNLHGELRDEGIALSVLVTTRDTTSAAGTCLAAACPHTYPVCSRTPEQTLERAWSIVL